MLKATMAIAALSENILWLNDEAIKEVAARFTRSKRSILAIDGFMNAGKSVLAGKVADEIGVQCLHVDDFLPSSNPEHEQCLFLDVLDLSRLRQTIADLRANGPVLIEGILLRDILSKQDSIFSVYVAAVWRPDPGSIRWNEVDRLKPGSINRPLDQQIVEYHLRCRPQELFDLAILRDQDA